MIILIINILLLATLLDKCSKVQQFFGVVLFDMALSYTVLDPMMHKYSPEESRKTMFDSDTGKPYTRITLDTPWYSLVA